MKSVKKNFGNVKSVKKNFGNMKSAEKNFQNVISRKKNFPNMKKASMISAKPKKNLKDGKMKSWISIETELEIFNPLD